MSSDAESDLTELSDLQPPNTPGYPLTPGRPAASDGEGATVDNNTVASTQQQSVRPALASRTRRVAKDPAEFSSATSFRKLKVKPTSQPAARSERGGNEEPSTAAETAPRPSLKIKIHHKAASKPGIVDVSHASEASKPSLADTLRELGDEEGDEDGLAGASTQKGRRKTRRPIIPNDQDGSDIEDASAMPEIRSEVSRRSKRKRHTPAGAGALTAKKRKPSAKERAATPPDDFEVADDSDEEMFDVTSEAESNSSEKFCVEVAATKPKTKSRRSQPLKNGGMTRAEATNLKLRASDIKDASKSASSATVKKPSVAELNKMVAAKIRASAAASTTLTSSTGSSSNPETPATAGDQNPSLLAPRKRPVALKPRGSDMWGSLVGHSRPSPRPPPLPKGEANKVAAPADETTKRESEHQQTDLNRSRQPIQTESSVFLPRPLGTGSTIGSMGNRSTSAGHNLFRGPGSGAGGGPYARKNTFHVHMTPGLNGQHWDKGAYRQLRIAEKHRYRNPVARDTSGVGLLNLLEDAEVLAAFEDEWRSLRIRDRVRYPALKYWEYGAGLEYAQALKQSRQAGQNSASAGPAEKPGSDANGVLAV